MSNHIHQRRNSVKTNQYANYCAKSCENIAIDYGLDSRAAKEAGRYAAAIIRAGKSARTAIKSGVQSIWQVEND